MKIFNPQCMCRHTFTIEFPKGWGILFFNTSILLVFFSNVQWNKIKEKENDGKIFEVFRSVIVLLIPKLTIRNVSIYLFSNHYMLFQLLLSNKPPEAYQRPLLTLVPPLPTSYKFCRHMAA